MVTFVIFEADLTVSKISTHETNTSTAIIMCANAHKSYYREGLAKTIVEACIWPVRAGSDPYCHPVIGSTKLIGSMTSEVVQTTMCHQVLNQILSVRLGSTSSMLFCEFAESLAKIL